jgi:hypothetical protein
VVYMCNKMPSICEFICELPHGSALGRRMYSRTLAGTVKALHPFLYTRTHAPGTPPGRFSPSRNGIVVLSQQGVGIRVAPSLSPVLNAHRDAASMLILLTQGNRIIKFE